MTPIINHHYLLTSQNTLGIEAFCDVFVRCPDAESLLAFLDAYDGEPLLVIGGGSNLLFAEDFRGIILSPEMKGIHVISDGLVQVAAGETWDNFVEWAVSHHLFGIENLSGIPGTVGAAAVQNIGAYGMEVGNVIQRVAGYRMENREMVPFEMGVEECAYAYRDSYFKHQPRGSVVVTDLFLQLSEESPLTLGYGNLEAELLHRVENVGLSLSSDPKLLLPFVRESVLAIRDSKLPDPKQLPNAGSFFKNPVVTKEKADALQALYPEMPRYPREDGAVKLAAGWLIEKSGWKGKSLGPAAVHDRQALVLVNRGGATGAEIIALAKAIQADVYKLFGVSIEPEVQVVNNAPSILKLANNNA